MAVWAFIQYDQMHNRSEYYKPQGYLASGAEMNAKETELEYSALVSENVEVASSVGIL